jgi:hypothetical protein
MQSPFGIERKRVYMSINHAQGPEPRWQRRSGPKGDAGYERGIIVLAGPLAKDCPESCQATRINTAYIRMEDRGTGERPLLND